MFHLQTGRLMDSLWRQKRVISALAGILGFAKACSSAGETKAKVFREYRKGMASWLMALLRRRIVGPVALLVR
jgi:hypothetical protein